MKRGIIMLSIALTLLSCSLSAQSTFIYGMQGEKMYLQDDFASIVISFKTMEYTSDYIYRIVNGGNIIVNDMVVKK